MTQRGIDLQLDEDEVFDHDFPEAVIGAIVKESGEIGIDPKCEPELLRLSLEPVDPSF